MEDGKEVVDVGKGDGVVDVVGKLGSEVEGVRGRVEEEGNIDGATSEVEVQVRENCESGEKVWEGRGNIKDYSGNNGNGINDGEDVKEVASDDVEVNVDGKVEGESEGVWTDEVLRLEVKEEVEQTEVAGAAEGIQIVAASDGKEVRPEEAFDVKELKEQNGEGEFQQLEETVVQEETNNQDAEIQVEDAATGTTDHNCGENFENLPEAPSSAATDKENHTECLELPVAAKCQAEASLPEATVNGVLGAGVAESNAIIENDGDKLDVLSQVDFDTDVQPENGMSQMDWNMTNEKVDHDESKENNFETPEKQIQQVKLKNSKADEEQSNPSIYLARDESGTEEEQIAFFREVEAFFKARGTDFRPPKFYGEPLNLLKLWRAVIRLGGYEQVTSCKLWRQIGESFNPPKTCTTVSWTFRLFYEKALHEFEKHKMRDGDLPNDNSYTEFDTETQSGGSQGLASGRVMRDSAARAMQGWHSQRNLSNDEIGDPIIKDKSLGSTLNREKLTKSNDFAYLKRKTTSPIEHPSKLARSKSPRPQMEISVIDAGEPANWVKINIRKTKDCFEIYALVPGLTREEVRVQSDPAGRLVISGEPQQLDNPWGVKPFKKVVSLPSRIDPHQTSAVVTLHGQLFVRVPFEPSDEH